MGPRSEEQVLKNRWPGAGLWPDPKPHMGMGPIVQRPGIVVMVLCQLVRLPQNAPSSHGGPFYSQFGVPRGNICAIVGADPEIVMRCLDRPFRAFCTALGGIPSQSVDPESLQPASQKMPISPGRRLE